MRHQKSGKKLGRNSAQRKSLMMNLTTALIDHGRIQTTEAKAKEVRPLIDKLLKLAKNGDIHSRRQAMAVLRNKSVVHKLFAEVAPRYEDRGSGFTRIVKIGPRQGDNAPIVLLELV